MKYYTFEELENLYEAMEGNKNFRSNKVTGIVEIVTVKATKEEDTYRTFKRREGEYWNGIAWVESNLYREVYTLK